MEDIAVVRTVALGMMLVAIPVSVNAQSSVLDKANNFLGQLTGNRAGNAQRPGMSAALNRQTAAQVSAQQAALNAPVQALIAADRAEAKQLIERIVSVSACAANDTGWNTLNRMSENPKTYENHYNSYTAIAKTKFHSKSNCLDVLRVTKWSKPAKNGLTFVVQLVSAQSDEAVSQEFTLIKDDSNEWLLRSVGFATS